MAYIDGFDNDIFLSYAHIDNADDGSARWVEVFGKQLSTLLLKRVGETVTVWWDPKLDRSQLFDEVIQKAVQSSAIVVSLVSPAYVKRDYCRQELEWFRACESLKTATAHSRVFPVLLYKLPYALWPDACRGSSGFDFFDAAFDQDLSRPLDPKSGAFWDAQWKLVAELARVLDEIRKTRVSATPAPSTAPAGGGSGAFRVFLGAASDELVGDRSFLKKELVKQGVEVLGKVPPPDDERGHEEAVREALAKADLSVHLLGNLPGRPFDEDAPGNTYSMAQTSIALELAGPQLVLLPESFAPENIEDARYAGFIKDLQARPRQGGGMQIIKTGRAQMLVLHHAGDDARVQLRARQGGPECGPQGRHCSRDRRVTATHLPSPPLPERREAICCRDARRSAS
jgi:TIR domain-containing protein